MNRLILLSITATLLMQCASSYRSIDPPTVVYPVNEETDDLDFSYRYDVLQYRGNRKYPKRERKHGFNILSAKITNKTDRTLNFARDLELYTQRGTVFPAEGEYTAKTIRQPVFIYILYGLLVYREAECTGYGCEITKVIPVGLGISAINMIIGGSANAKMKAEFNNYGPHTKNLAPGETVYVIIAVRDIAYAPLKLKIREKPAN